MNKLFFLIAVVLALTACRTPKEAAQYHIKKALRLDSNAITDYRTDTTIRDTARGIVPYQNPNLQGEGDLKESPSSNTTPTSPKTYTLVDSNINLTIKTDGKGNLKAKYDIPGKIVYVPVKIPYEIQIEVPGKAVNIEVDRKFYKYGWFWGMLAGLLLLLYLWLSGIGALARFQRRRD